LYASPVPDAFEISRLLYVNREARNLVLRRCGRITVDGGPWDWESFETVERVERRESVGDGVVDCSGGRV
jgi:hypothetical protein